jgi:hypothetical protein
MSNGGKGDGSVPDVPGELGIALSRLGRAITDHSEPTPEDQLAEAPVKSSLRPAPKGDMQGDFFGPALYGVGALIGRRAR